MQIDSRHMRDSRQFSDVIASQQQCECRSRAIADELKQMRLAGLEPVPEFFVLAQQFIAGTLSVDAFAQMGKSHSFGVDVTSEPDYIDERRSDPPSKKTLD